MNRDLNNCIFLIKMNFLEWFYCGDTIKTNSLTLYFLNYAPTCLSQNQHGFVQEQRFTIQKECPKPNTPPQPPYSKKVPPLFFNTLAYSPYYISDFEQGTFYYPIILNPFLYNSQYYNYPLQLYIFYMSINTCNQQFYYINVPYLYVDPKDPSHDQYMVLIYRHPVYLEVKPIQYCWKLHKVLVPINTTHCHSQLEIYCNLHQKVVLQDHSIFKTMDNKNTAELVSEPLLFHFYKNYNYVFGFNYGMNGVLPSNNSPFLQTTLQTPLCPTPTPTPPPTPAPPPPQQPQQPPHPHPHHPPPRQVMIPRAFLPPPRPVPTQPPQVVPHPSNFYDTDSDEEED